MKLKKDYIKIANSLILTRLLSGRLFLGNFIIIANILSAIVSWHFNKSVMWALFHYVFGFWNLLYNLLAYRFADGGFIEIFKSYF